MQAWNSKLSAVYGIPVHYLTILKRVYHSDAYLSSKIFAAGINGDINSCWTRREDARMHRMTKSIKKLGQKHIKRMIKDVRIHQMWKCIKKWDVYFEDQKKNFGKFNYDQRNFRKRKTMELRQIKGFTDFAGRAGEVIEEKRSTWHDSWIYIGQRSFINFKERGQDRWTGKNTIRAEW